ncbi:MAG: UDP-N-acetylglucosamine 1-carboxyvinyltransferase [Candidatus Magasanikbacteria bacterium]
MAYYEIEGPNTVDGDISVSAGKNSTIALMCASVLVEGEVILNNMSHVEDVDRIIEILKSIGAEVEWLSETKLRIDTSMELDISSINKEACKKTRVSLLFIGALAKRKNNFKIYRSGGCKLGERTTRPHRWAMEKLGVEIDNKMDCYDIESSQLKGEKIVMYESSDTATENTIMAAVLADGVTEIRMASANYMVQDLCYFLNKAGADISGIGTTSLNINGVSSLKDRVEYTIMPDPIEAMTWISLAVTTDSNLTIKNCPLQFLELELEKLSVMGLNFNIENKRKSESDNFKIADIVIKPSELEALPDKLSGRPFPGLNIDAVPLFTPILTQAKGKTLVHDWCYENRAVYYLELQKLGADVLLMDPHRAMIEGQTELLGNEVIAPPAIRPAMAILNAMIAAEGSSVLRNIYPIERGYQDLIPRLKDLGINIKKIQDE